MNIFSIALKSLRQRFVPSALTGFSVALGVSLMVGIIVVNEIVTRMFEQSGSGYDLVVGPVGSETQLVLSTIYHIDKPIENLPWRFYKELEQHKFVEHAIPINIGDTTDEGNFPIVGTTPRFFIQPYSGEGDQFKIRGHGLQGTWDSVIGSAVAKKNGWKVGSTFKLIHSGNDDHVHDEKFTVVGVMAPTGTPNDKTAFVHIDGFFQLDEHATPPEQAIKREAMLFNETEEEVMLRYQDDLAELLSHEGEDDGHHHHNHGPVSDLQKEVTSILVTTRGELDSDKANTASLLQEEFKERNIAQGANTVAVMRRLMQNLVGNVRLACMYLTAMIIAVSGIGIFVSIYNSMSERKKEIAIMRALGARRQTVFSIILLESIILCVLGGLLGIALGHLGVIIAAPIIESRSGLLIDPMTFSWIELIVIPVLIVMASVVGVLPGMTAYQTDVAEALNS